MMTRRQAIRILDREQRTMTRKWRQRPDGEPDQQDWYDEAKSVALAAQAQVARDWWPDVAAMIKAARDRFVPPSGLIQRLRYFRDLLRDCQGMAGDDLRRLRASIRQMKKQRERWAQVDRAKAPKKVAGGVLTNRDDSLRWGT